MTSRRRPAQKRRKQQHIRPAGDRPTQRAANQRRIIDTPKPVRVLADVNGEFNECPVCGAGIAEEGGLGCCGAITATCEGSVAGVPVDWKAVYASSMDDDAIDAFAETVTHHNWYIDTGEEAPDEMGRTAVRCRCERTGG